MQQKSAPILTLKKTNNDLSNQFNKDKGVIAEKILSKHYNELSKQMLDVAFDNAYFCEVQNQYFDDNRRILGLDFLKKQAYNSLYDEYIQFLKQPKIAKVFIDLYKQRKKSISSIQSFQQQSNIFRKILEVSNK